MEPICARCGAVMALAPIGTTNGLGCPRCRAVLLSHEHAARVRAGVERWAVDTTERAAAGAPRIDPRADTRTLACPVCRNAMVPEWVASAGVRLDACAAHGVFFDAHEVAAVVPPEKRRPVAVGGPDYGSVAATGFEVLLDIFGD